MWASLKSFSSAFTLSWWSILLGSILSCEPRSEVPTQPNVLLILTDQQTVGMMSAAGNPYLETPAMDQLARNGVMFLQSYCTSPVCAPARSSIITGKMPHETGVEWNGDKIKDSVLNIGEIFRESGYQTVWAGKWHLPESYPQRTNSPQKEIRGFDLLPFRDPDLENWMLGAETDPPLTRAAVKFLEQHSNNQPFFLAVSYHNPHDICFYARKDGWETKQDSLLEIRHYGFEYQLPKPISRHPKHFEKLPPLPANYPIPELEPSFLQDKRNKHHEYGVETMLANQEFDSLTWRGYYHAYCRLTEMVDGEIAKLLAAVSNNALLENTLIVFSSDHGDGAAAHKWAAKLSFYEESAKVPLIISWPGEIAAGIQNHQHLVSQIDIVPTLCDYLGIDAKISFTGRSLRPIIENPTASWRNFLVAELADYKPDRSRKGRMVRTESFKYNSYSGGENPEQLFDLKNDPGEMYNLAYHPDYQSTKDWHKQLLMEWKHRTKDDFLAKDF